MKTYIVHFGELGLKGKNRTQFEQQLVLNIRTTLEAEGDVEVRRFYSYILVHVDEDIPPEVVEDRLSRIFGIAYFAPAEVVAQDMDAITAAALRLADGVITPETTFRIATSRGDKQFRLTSPEVDAQVGAEVVGATHAPVDLENPDVTLYIQIYRDGVYLFIRKLGGAGGLPVGVSGRVLTLFSGGIDSPVAAHLVMKRGCTTDFLHFHLLPSAERVRASKIPAMARAVLQAHRRPARLYLASAAPFETAMAEIDTRVATVVFRRFIMRVAERIAHRRDALALITGESIGQVASQTLKNINLIARPTTMPILRPLIGLDKEEIIALAKGAGTYDLSIQPYRDPCSLRVRRPATWAKLDTVQRVEAQIQVDALVEETLADHVEELRLRFEDT
jgi:thiamine biosynthesis protein ThiI